MEDHEEVRYLICPVCRVNVLVPIGETSGFCYECKEDRDFVTWADIMIEEREREFWANEMEIKWSKKK